MTSYNVNVMEQALQKLDLSTRESKVYLALLGLGPSPLRKIAEEIDTNRGSTYDALKSLMKKGLVSFYDKDKKQHFVAEDPENLIAILREKRREIAHAKKELSKILPELRARFKSGDKKPSVKLYEGRAGAKAILEDLLRVMGSLEKKEYYVYSSANIREHLYKDFSSFSERRVELGIKVKVVALGSGGELRGLDERRWLNSKETSPSYILVFGAKVAILSLSEESYLTSVLIEDSNLATTQKIIFETIWNKLPVS